MLLHTYRNPKQDRTQWGDILKMTRSDTGSNQGGLQAPRFLTLAGWGSHEVSALIAKLGGRRFLLSSLTVISERQVRLQTMLLGKQQRFTCEKWVQTVPDTARFVSYTTIPRTTPTLQDPSKVRQCIWFKGDIALGFPSKLALGNVTFVSCFIVRFCETHFSCT